MRLELPRYTERFGSVLFYDVQKIYEIDSGMIADEAFSSPFHVIRQITTEQLHQLESDMAIVIPFVELDGSPASVQDYLIHTLYLRPMKNAADFFRAPADAKPLRIADEAEACSAVLMACLRANELDPDAQNAAFYTTIRSRNIFKGQDADALIAAAGHYYEQAGSPARLIDAAIGAIREQTRLPLFYHCLDVILADGVVTPEEHRVFQYLKGKFKVEDELAWKALEILVAKNLL